MSTAIAILTAIAALAAGCAAIVVLCFLVMVLALQVRSVLRVLGKPVPAWMDRL